MEWWWKKSTLEDFNTHYVAQCDFQKAMHEKHEDCLHFFIRDAIMVKVIREKLDKSSPS